MKKKISVRLNKDTNKKLEEFMDNLGVILGDKLSKEAENVIKDSMFTIGAEIYDSMMLVRLYERNDIIRNDESKRRYELALDRLSPRYLNQARNPDGLVDTKGNK